MSKAGNNARRPERPTDCSTMLREIAVAAGVSQDSLCGEPNGPETGGEAVIRARERDELLAYFDRLQDPLLRTRLIELFRSYAESGT